MGRNRRTLPLPQTRTSKNGIRSGDEKLAKLFEWIKSTHPGPHKDLTGAIRERELVEKLKELKEANIEHPTKHVEQDFPVFKTVSPGNPVLADLYVYDGKYRLIYEAKKDVADVQNIYQLLMYWDGAVSDGLQPYKGILIASDFAPGVDAVLTVINGMKDQNGKPHMLEKRTWKKEGVPYPKP